MAGLRLEKLGLDYLSPQASVPAFSGLDLSLGEGEILSIVGPSGCGKSSLLRVLSGLEAPSRGRIVFEGEGEAPRPAIIFQDYGLLPWKTVRANTELPLALAGIKKRQRGARSLPMLEELGLSDFADFFPNRLSGGMRQRVALARAFVQEPRFLLMDEPFSSLDELSRESMQKLLLDIQARHRASVLLVTHSIAEAAYLSDRVLVMRGRNPGRLEATIEAPEARFQRQGYRTSEAFLGFMNQIRRALEGDQEG